MPSPESAAIRKTIVKDCVPDIPIQEERRRWESYAATLPLPSGVQLRQEAIAGVACCWVQEDGARGSEAILYVHGGGLISGSSVTHREYACRLTLRVHVPVLIVDYRLAPEHPFPAALLDVSAVYRELLLRGFSPAQLVVGGDSTGAGLALSVLVELARGGVPLPAAAFFISGHFDMGLSGESMSSRSDVDPFTSRAALERCAAWYAPGMDLRAAGISPLFADLRGLPPMLLQVGDHEILLSDSIRLAESSRAQRGRVELRVWDAMWHTWPMYAGLPEADEAMDEIGRFLDHLRVRDAIPGGAA